MFQLIFQVALLDPYRLSIKLRSASPLERSVNYIDQKWPQLTLLDGLPAISDISASGLSLASKNIIMFVNISWVYSYLVPMKLKLWYFKIT